MSKMDWTVLVYCCLALLVARLLVGVLAGTLLRSPRRQKTMIVLGSGGHTAEMMALLKGLDTGVYSPRCYVVAATDRMSGQKAEAFEAELAAQGQQGGEQASNDAAAAASAGVQTRRRAAALHRRALQQGAAEPAQPQPEGHSGPAYSVVRIPRSREVGQSFVSSVWTTLYALWFALSAAFAFRPDVLLVNGPGTCIPICAATALVRALGLVRGRTVYVESIARVYRLSLTGKILYHLQLTDRFFVQWPDLQAAYPRCAYAGRVM